MRGRRIKQTMPVSHLKQATADSRGPVFQPVTERVDPRWEDSRTVATFASGLPNQQLLDFARGFLTEAHTPRCLDLGCGAARNALPLARMGFHVTGTDLSMGMIEAARVARSGAGLFVFTFSRHTLPEDASPDPGETFVFSSWNGEPQCFLSENELIAELARGGFAPTETPLTEYNRSAAGVLRVGGPPVIYEGKFTRTAHG